MRKYKARFFVLVPVLLCTLAHAQKYMSRCGGRQFELNAYSFTKTLRPYNRGYRNDDVCRWRITAPLNMAIKLSFDVFSLGMHRMNCWLVDFLEVFDGASSLNQTLGQFCGADIPPLIVSKGRYLVLRFRSYHQSAGWGFTFSYQAVFPEPSYTKCTLKNSFANNNNIMYSASSGYIYSPEYPSNYPKNVQCTWRISAPSGLTIKLYLEDMNMPSINYCPHKDYLEVRDGAYSRSSKIGYYCGTSRKIISSSGRHLWIRFRSDYSNNLNDFKLRYTFEGGKIPVGVIVGVLAGVAVIIALILIIVWWTKKKGTTNQVPESFPLQPTDQVPPPYPAKNPQAGDTAPEGSVKPPPAQDYAGPTSLGYDDSPNSGQPPQGYSEQPAKEYDVPLFQEYQGLPPYPGPPLGGELKGQPTGTADIST